MYGTAVQLYLLPAAPYFCVAHTICFALPKIKKFFGYLQTYSCILVAIYDILQPTKGRTPHTPTPAPTGTENRYGCRTLF